MKYFSALFLLAFLLCHNGAQAQYGFAHQGFGTGDERAVGVTTDAWGNAYVIGRFTTASVTVNTNNGPMTLTNNGGADFFIARYDPTGALDWAANYGGTGNERVWRVSVGANGIVAVVGHFDSPTLGFPGLANLVNSGGQDGFIVTFDPNGTPLWSRSITGSSVDEYRDVQVTASGIFCAGHLRSPNCQVGPVSLSNAGASTISDILVARYDLTGGVTWAAQYGNGPGHEAALGVSVNGDRVYMVGVYSGTLNQISFPGGFLTQVNQGSGDLFVAAFDAANPAANFHWVASGGGSSNDNFYDITTDRAGGVYIVGNSQSPTMSVPGFTVPPNASAPNMDVYTFKFAEFNGAAQWVRNGANTGFSWGNAIEADGCGNIYITGSFDAPSINFSGTVLTGGATYANPYLVQYNQAGTVTNALTATATGSSIGGTGNDIAIAIDNEPIYVGQFTHTISFLGAPGQPMTAPGTPLNDFFIAKAKLAPPVQWQQDSDISGGPVRGVDVTVDGVGDVYVTGTFEGPTTLGTPGGNTATLNGSGMYTAKYSECGQLLWAAQTVNGIAGAEAIALDEANGWVYVVGGLSTTGTEFFASGIVPGYTACTNFQAVNAVGYVARYDMANGCLDAVQTYGGTYKPKSIAVNEDSDIYLLAEYFIGSTKNFGISKLTSAFGFIWFQGSSASGSGTDVNAADITVKRAPGSSNDFVYATGNFFRDQTFGGFLLANPSVYDAWATKVTDFGASSTVNWFVKGNIASGGYAHSESVTTDPSGNAYITGSFKGSMNPVFGSGSLTSSGPGSAFVVRFNENGGGVNNWATRIFTDGEVIGTGVCADDSALYLTGYWHGGPAPGPLTFPTSQGIPSIPFAGNPANSSLYNSYVARYTFDNTSTGTWGNTTEGSLAHRAQSVAANNSGYAFTTGQYEGTMNLPPYYPGTQGQITSTVGVQDMFLIRTRQWTGEFFKTQEEASEQGAAQAMAAEESAEPLVFPNPNNGRFTVRFPNGQQGSIEIFDLNGQRLRQLDSIAGEAEIDLENVPAGMYLMRWQSESGETGTQRIILQ